MKWKTQRKKRDAREWAEWANELSNVCLCSFPVPLHPLRDDSPCLLYRVRLDAAMNDIKICSIFVTVCCFCLWLPPLLLLMPLRIFQSFLIFFSFPFCMLLVTFLCILFARLCLIMRANILSFLLYECIIFHHNYDSTSLCRYHFKQHSLNFSLFIMHRLIIISTEFSTHIVCYHHHHTSCRDMNFHMNIISTWNEHVQNQQ